MVPIRQMLVSPSKYSIKCPYSMTPTRIIVHNTANDASANNEVSYMINNSNEVSFHVAVDDKEIVQGIPFSRNAWNAGDGSGKGNREGISIEICYSASGGSRFDKAEENAAEYIASLLNQYSWGIEKVTKHQDYNGKYCPHRTLDKGWNRFLNMVKKYMAKPVEEEEEMTYDDFKKFMTQYEKEKAKKATSKWAEPAVEYVNENNIMVGDTNGEFRAQSDITRQEVAQVIYALMKKLDK